MGPHIGHVDSPVSMNGMEAYDDHLNLTPVITAETHAQKRPPRQIVWLNIVFFTALHAAGLYGIYLGFYANLATIIWVGLLYWLTEVGITAGAHRLWSHRSYKAKLPYRAFLAVLNSMAYQNDIIEWSRDHRVHHKFSETDADPHNAKRGFFFSHVGWLLQRKHPDVIAKGRQLDISDLLNDPVLQFQRKYYYPSVALFCFIIPTIVPVLMWGESAVISFFVCGLARYVLTLNATWLVNSAAHMWGWKPYDRTINPSQNPVVSLLASGEGFHNYHHTFPQDYSTAELGWVLNSTTLFIDFFALLGQVYDRKSIPKHVIQKRRERTGDKQAQD